ncbi:MAG TPA: hypothetical protein PKV67_00295 [Hyphomonas sp.]|nr:hypothetical protein [Hyphomonas sp.]HRI99185.1 hypothetical protein [Hyphomonas sp.]HRK65934.1 hypothetical protein [Hyphomonas sp.]
MTRAILIRGLIVSILVGSLLTLINQFEVISALQTPNLLKMGLSYIVPFCVSVFSAMAVRKNPADPG